NTILKQVVELEGVFNPDEILSQLHLRIRVALKQGEDNSDTQNDGLDTALCMIDTKRMKLAYAGANRPLLLIRKGEAFEYKPEKYGVGGDMFEHEARKYAAHELDLQSKDTIYMYSDGFIDQIGEESDKRYGHRRFKEFLMSIQEHDMEHQRLLLEAEMQHWQGNVSQMDDMLVIGIRF
ncbi:MAG: PP2C family protein-serine/threonine phosphatase, partial [Bacteroidota bacterium]